MPRSATVELLHLPLYEKLDSITRCVHLKDAMICYDSKRLLGHQVNSSVVDVNAKVLWFAPTEPLNRHNPYGNVSFTIDFKIAVMKLGAPKYYIDQEDTGTHLYTRVLMTESTHTNLKSIEMTEIGTPFQINDNSIRFASSFSKDGVRKHHVVEFGIEVDNEMEKWLYSNCRIEANDHSLANQIVENSSDYTHNTCHRHNSFNAMCPSAFTIWQTKGILNSRCPSMLHDGSRPPNNVIQQVPSSGRCDDKVFTKAEYVRNYDDHDRSATSRRNQQVTGRGSSGVEDGLQMTAASGGNSSASMTNERRSSNALRGVSASDDSSTPVDLGSPETRVQGQKTLKEGEGEEEERELSTGEKVLLGMLAAGGVVLLASSLAGLCARHDKRRKENRIDRTAVEKYTRPTVNHSVNYYSQKKK